MNEGSAPIPCRKHYFGQTTDHRPCPDCGYIVEQQRPLDFQRVSAPHGSDSTAKIASICGNPQLILPKLLEPLLRLSNAYAAAAYLQELRSGKRLRPVPSMVGSSGDNFCMAYRSCSSVSVSTLASIVGSSRPRIGRNPSGSIGAATVSGSSISTCSWINVSASLACHWVRWSSRRSRVAQRPHLCRSHARL